MKFHLNNFYGCQLTERTRNGIANDQREITPKISKNRVMVLVHDMSSNVLYVNVRSFVEISVTVIKL